jgi:hypothetical protein
VVILGLQLNYQLIMPMVMLELEHQDKVKNYILMEQPVYDNLTIPNCCTMLDAQLYVVKIKTNRSIILGTTNGNNFAIANGAAGFSNSLTGDVVSRSANRLLLQS